MQKSVLQITTALLIFMLGTWSALGAIQPGNGYAWLVVGSRPTSSAAIDVASKLIGKFANVHVFRTSNGWFAITLGWASTTDGTFYKDDLIASGLIPDDSYFHNGQRFISMQWSSTGLRGRSQSRIIGATRLVFDNASEPAGGGEQNGYVTGLPAGDYLAVRTKPSRRGLEIARLNADTKVVVASSRNGWYQVQIPGGRQGWVFGKYITLGNQPIPTPPPSPKPQPKPEIIVNNSENGAQYVVSGLSRSADAYLALRSGPGTSNREIARLKSDTRLTVTGKANGWFRVRPNDAVEGWVFGKFISPFEVPVIGPPDPVANDNSEETKQPEVAEKPKKPEVGKIPDEKRVALVIGNSAYKHTTPLANPKNDADKISARLRALGFEVIVALDGTKASMENSIREFVKILPNSDVALFFYAGHAMQVKGENYLVPVDAKLADATAVDFETINTTTVLNFIDEPGRISIALLDACRDNPLSRGLARSLGATRSAFLGRGLASPNVGGGNILIGFATSPGEVALDGEGENSPFTEALLKHMDTPDLEIELMLKRVKARVYEATDGKQAPWHNSALRKEFYFVRN